MAEKKDFTYFGNTVKEFTPRESIKSTSIRDTKVLTKGFKLIDLTDGTEVLDVRLYEGKSRSASTVYCLAWLSWKQVYAAGSGSAGGGGYDKDSSAIADALKNAGLTFEKSFDGAGLNMAVCAMMSVAEHLGVPAPHIVKFYA